MFVKMYLQNKHNITQLSLRKLRDPTNKHRLTKTIYL